MAHEKRRYQKIKAEKEIIFTTVGNAGGIEVYYNEHKLNAFGVKGKIVKI